MASDVAEFLKRNFLETQHGLPLAVTNTLDDTKKELEENKDCWSPPPEESLSLFYQLDNAVAEFIDNSQQKTGLKTTFLPFSRLDPERDVKQIKTQLSKINEELIKIRNEKKKDASSFTSGPILFTKKHSHYFLHEENRDKIVKWLSSDEGFKAIGIHGMCGTGKTTLVKEVLGDKNVLANYAEPIWVNLFDLTSAEEMDIRIVKEMLARLNDDPDLLTEEPNDDWLVKRLHGKLKALERKYLVVLDGVWHCNSWFSNLSAHEDDRSNQRPFRHALPKDIGGAVIVTSRVREVTKMLVGGEHLIHVEPCDKEKMKKFVMQLWDARLVTLDENLSLDDIVYHCHGLPLVAEQLFDWIAEQINKKPSSQFIEI